MQFIAPLDLTKIRLGKGMRLEGIEPCHISYGVSLEGLAVVAMRYCVNCPVGLCCPQQIAVGQVYSQKKQRGLYFDWQP